MFVSKGINIIYTESKHTEKKKITSTTNNATDKM